MFQHNQIVRRRHLAALGAFILRARRVEQHSLARDRRALLTLPAVPGSIEVHVTGKTYAVQELPPEEQIESAAARIQPLLVNSEPTYHGKFTQAIGYFIHAAPHPSTEVNAAHRDINAQWNAIKPPARDPNGYHIQTSNIWTEEAARTADNVLAFAWIHGDVVHDPRRLNQTHTFGVAERYRAAVPVVAHIMALTIATLNFVRLLQRTAIIPDIAGAYDTDVTVTNLRQEGPTYVDAPSPTAHQRRPTDRPAPRVIDQ